MKTTCKPHLNQYDSWENSLGIFLNGEQVFFFPDSEIKDEHKVVRTYEFKLEWTNQIYLPHGTYNPSERLEFLCEMALIDLPIKVIKGWSGNFDEDDLVDKNCIDWEKFVTDVQPKLLKYVKERLTRKLKKRNIPEPLIHTEGSWHNGDEFLWFTDETAHHWAGPFHQDGKKGCVISIWRVERSLHSPINPQTDWHFYDLPYRVQKQSGTDSNGMYYWTPEEKTAFITNLPVRDYYDTMTKFFEGVARQYPYRLGYCMPITLGLYGNDDCSYSLFLANEEELEKELEYLRKMQPLDFSRDIAQRGYLFTN